MPQAYYQPFGVQKGWKINLQQGFMHSLSHQNYDILYRKSTYKWLRNADERTNITGTQYKYQQKFHKDGNDAELWRTPWYMF